MPEELRSRIKRNPDRRLSIIEGVLSGKKQREVAAEHDVTRQYVSLVMKNYHADPSGSAEKKKRGRRPAQLLSPGEAREMRQLLLDETPEQHGFKTPKWRPGDARKLIIQRTGKYVTIQRLRAQLREWGIDTQPDYERDPYLDSIDDDLPMAPLEPAAPPPPPPRRRRGRPSRAEMESAGPAVSHSGERYSEEDMRQMEEANREAMARLQRAQEENSRYQPKGRHNKQKRTPFTPPKKRRKR